MNEYGYRTLITKLVGSDGEEYFRMRDKCLETIKSFNINSEHSALFMQAFELGFLSAKEKDER